MSHEEGRGEGWSRALSESWPWAARPDPQQRRSASAGQEAAPSAGGRIAFLSVIEACVPEESAMLYFKESALSCFSEVEILGVFHFRGAGEGFVEFGSNAPISPL